MSVLITGASGSIGREAVRACRERGLGVVIGAAAAAPARGIRRLDFLDHTTWSAALDGCSSVFVVRPPGLVNTHTTLSPFIDTARRRGIKHLLFLSVPGADKNEQLPEYAVERHIEKAGTDWTILRPGFAAQHFQDSYHTDIVEDDRVYVPAGKAHVAFVDLRDVGDLIAAIFADPGEHRRAAYTLTGPSTFTFEGAAALLSAATDRPIHYVPASTIGFTWHLWRHRGLPYAQAAEQTEQYRPLRKGEASQVDPSLEGLLGRPARSLADYISDSAANWWTASPDQDSQGGRDAA